MTSAAFSIEVPLDPSLHLLVQTEWESSTLRDLGPKVAEHEQMLLWIGAPIGSPLTSRNIGLPPTM